jgi:lipopolysaccharide/colanic/teichoic acid biosynthesis glycosyltransferase
MVKRLFDILAASTALSLLAPLLVCSAIGVRLSSAGPALYRARRVGRGGREFVMYKFRTMHVAASQGSVITASSDSRVFSLGRILRALKIDELPQLWNVIRGDMSIVGPRPEDPKIVQQHFGNLGMETLSVAPGLASPGSLYNYTHGHLMVDHQNPEAAYVQQLLPVKLALELVYVRQRSLRYDFGIILRTAVTILQIAAGKKSFPDPPEMLRASSMLKDSPHLFVR